MKKNKVLAFGLCSILLLSSAFVSCSNGSSSDSSSSSSSSSTTQKDSGSGNGNGGAGNNGGTTNNGGTANNGGSGNGGASADTTNTGLQAKITEAKAGSTVTLTAGKVAEGSSITIDKALTVDGNGIDGLTVKVSSAVSSNVVLKNFKNATIKVYTPAAVSSSIRSARAAEGETKKEEAGEDELKKFGHDVMPLYLEGCTVEKLEAEEDFALYLGSGEDRTVIDELCLREGVEDFTFIEFDEKDTATADKSKVEKFSIEDDGIKEINLIGGTFGDVDFADNFAGEIDFKYDREFEDQFAKDDFMDETFIKERDVAIADNVAASGKSGVYKLEINKADFNYLNGNVSIVFLKDEQIAMLKPAGNEPAAANMYKVFTPEMPIYCMSFAGDFGIELDKSGLNTVFGSESYIYKPVWKNGICNFKTIAYDNYPVYSKEAVIADIGENTVTYYVNMNAVKKTDLIIGANTISSVPIGGPGEKISDIDLTGYKAYFAVDARKMYCDFNADAANIAAEEAFAIESKDEYSRFADGLPNPDGQAGFAKPGYITTEALKSNNSVSMDGYAIEIPVYNSVQFVRGMPYFIFFPMNEADAYPAGAATTTDASVKVKDAEYATVYYFDAEGKKGAGTQVNKMSLSSINLRFDDFEYYTDEALTKYAFDPASADPDTGLVTPDTLYARPYREINILMIRKADEPLGSERLEHAEEVQLSSGEPEYYGDRLGYIDTLMHDIYLTYNTSTKRLEDKVTISELAASVKAGDTVYIALKE